MKKLTVVIPVKNEAKNVIPLVQRIHKALMKAHIIYDVVFIDDHSSDNTYIVLKNLSKKYPIKVYKKIGKPGKAYSILEGARKSKNEFIAMIDGDLQYPPELLPALYEKAVINGVAVGNRTKKHTNIIRQFASKAYRHLFGKVLMGMNADVQSGIKVFRREIIMHISENEVTPWTLDMPLLHTARELGYKIDSVDMEFLERANGQSNIKVVSASAEIGIRALRLRLSKRKIYKIRGNKDTIQGSGLAYKGKRYITHTALLPKNSAIMTTTYAQRTVIFAVIGTLILGLLVNPYATGVAFTALLSLIYFIDVLFSGYVLLKSLHFPPEIVVSDEKINELQDKNLPVYSVLCPLYREAHILPQFVEAMNTLDWPKNKLEVLLLLEEDDIKTIEAARSMKLPSHFKIVVVPHSLPKSKPKACNYGLTVSKGEYVVIYDAEDKPDPLQLKKVYLSFIKLGKKYGCIQCKLNYFNSTHNLLTRLFTAEYSLWFDVILPGLQSIEGIIPLGGTSNHFRRADLISLNGWDPFNVTEDADLGMRLFKNGYKTAIVDSTTLEEANSKVWNWVRQRSRWIKGYFQTYLVHMRNPIELAQDFGIQALVFQLVIGMRMTFMLINPILWLITISYFVAYKIVGPTIESLYPPLVFYMAAFALIVGNFMYLYNYMIGCAKRGQWGLIKFVFFVPFYWILTSVAAVMALWQLITKPHYWEKTNHGLHLNSKKENRSPEIVKNSKVLIFSKFLLKRSGGFLNKGTIAGLLLILASFVGNIFNFLYNAYLGRQLSPEIFGLIGLIGSFLSISQIVMSGLGRTVTYKSGFLLGKHGRTIKEFWQKTRYKWLILSIVIAFIWVLATPSLMNAFHSSDPLPFLLFSPVWVIGVLSAIDSGFLTGNLKFGIIAGASIVESFTKLIFAVAFVSFGKSELVYAAVPLSMFVAFFVTWMAVIRMKAEKISDNSDEDLIFPKRFFTTSIIAKISSVIFLSMDVLLVKLYLSSYDAGVYTLLSLVGSIVFFTGTLFAQFITPLVSKVEGEGKNSNRVFNILILATTLSSTFAFLVFGIFGNVTVPILFGVRSLPLLQYLVPYLAAMVFATIALNIASYQQIKNRHFFPIVSLIVSAIFVLAIMNFHKDFEQVVQVIVYISAFHLIVMVLLHTFYSKLIFAIKNLTDFVGLFRTIPLVNKKLKKGNLRILVLNWRDTKHKWAGGAEIYIHEIAKRWAKNGNQVTVFCGNDGKSMRHEVVDGVRIVRRGGFYTVYLWSFLYYVLRFGGKFDVIVDFENGVPFFTPIYSRIPKFLVVFHIHQEVFRENLMFPFSVIAMFIEKRIMPFMYRNAKHITISESSKRDLVRIGCAAAKNVEIVTPGIDLDVYKTTKKSVTPTFACLGRLRPYKNVDVAIKAFNHVVKKHKNSKLYIVGEGDSYKSLKKLVSQLSLEKSVVFTGFVTDEEKVKILGKSWVVLQPSSFEGWGLTVIEANACGTPVIASNTNGLRDSVIDGKTGILVPVKNVDILAREMLELTVDSKYRKDLSSESIAWAKQFSWDKSAEKFAKLLNTEEKYLKNEVHLINKNI